MKNNSAFNGVWTHNPWFVSPTELSGKSIMHMKNSKFLKYFCNYVSNLCQTREGVAQVVIYSGH